MPMRLGTRAFFKSLLLMAGLPSLLLAQGPASPSNYQPPGFVAQPQPLPSLPNMVAPAPAVAPAPYGVQPFLPQSGSGVNNPSSMPQVQTGPYSTRPSINTQGVINTQVWGVAPAAPALPGNQQPQNVSPTVPFSTTQSPANLPTASLPGSISAQPVGFPGSTGSIIGRRSNNLEPTSANEAFGRLKPFPSLSSMPVLGSSESREDGSRSELTRINAPAQFASFQDSEYAVAESVDATAVNCADAPWCSGASNSGCFASLEALLFFINKPNVATFGDEASERLVSVNSVVFSFENSLDTSWMSNDGAWGQRIDFGNVKGDGGWYASFWNVNQDQSYSVNGVNFAPSDPFSLMSGFFDGDNDGIDDDLNNNQIYGRFGQDLGTLDAGPPPGFILPFDGTPDVGAPIDSNDMITYLQTFSQVVSSNRLTMQNFELNRLLRVPGHNWNNEFDYYYGLRYLKVRDVYDVTANGGFLDQSFWHAESDNNLFGPQIGARWSRRAKAIGFSVDGRFLAAYNQQDNDLRGQYASNLTSVGVANAPAALTRLSFIDGFGHDVFSPAGEIRADMVLKMSRSWAFKVGYTGIVIDNISRSSPKIVYALPASSLQDVDSNTTLFSQGVNFGLEYNR